MNLSKLKSLIGRQLTNFQGWRTNRKIIVFESDDWGSIRMPSRKVFERLLQNGIRVDRCVYNRFDSLASEEDLGSLFNILMKFKDANGYHPIITANSLMANPDFDKIKASKYEKYHFELFTETLKHYPLHQNSFNLWKEGL